MAEQLGTFVCVYMCVHGNRCHLCPSHDNHCVFMVRGRGGEGEDAGTNTSSWSNRALGRVTRLSSWQLLNMKSLLPLSQFVSLSSSITEMLAAAEFRGSPHE